MRVVISAHNSRKGGGVSVARNLIAAIGKVAPQNDYLFTIPPDLGYESCCRIAPRSQCLAYRHTGLATRWWWETTVFPKIVARFEPNLLFNIANRGICSPAALQATLVQDAHLFYPSCHFGEISLKERMTFWYHRRHFRKSLRFTQLLFCQTEVARRRLLATYGNGMRIEICPNALSQFAARPSADTAIPAALAPYGGMFKLLVLTRYYPHKNLEIIPTVFRQHQEALRDVLVVLTISASEASGARQLLDAIQAAGLSRHIVTVGPIAQEELPSYYAHSDGLLLPTLLESYSGTYVEAMAYGRPILTSDRDFARAVCGEAAIYFDPRDPSSIASAIVRVRHDPAIRASLAVGAAKLRDAFCSSWEDIAAGITTEWEKLVRDQVHRPGLPGKVSQREDQTGTNVQ